MGVFSKEKKEVYEITHQLIDANPYYPFIFEGPGRLVLRVRYRRFWVAACVALASLFLGVLLLALRQERENFFPLAVVTLCLSLATMWSYKDTRTIVLLREVGRYEFYLGSRLVHAGEIRNVYVRLRKRFDSSGHAYYWVSFNGYRVDKVDVTGASAKLAEMRRLGKRIAEAIDVNYFDPDNVSVHHAVRHGAKVVAEGQAERSRVVPLGAVND